MTCENLKERLSQIASCCSLKTAFLLAVFSTTTVVMVMDVGYPRQMIQHISYFPYYFRGRWKNGGMFMQNINTSRPTNLRQDVTIVTAYFNLGSFRKGHLQTYTPELYRGWMKIFSIIENPLVVFVDTDEDLEYFTKLRTSFPPNSTIIQKISRKKLWAFSLQPRIRKIYSSFGYPNHYPNTVLPEYSCAMHAKYELMQEVAWENFYKTRYIAWLDIGCFRGLDANLEKSLSIYIPPGLSQDQVAYSEVHRRNVKMTFREIFLDNHVWVSGSFFIGHVEAMLAWTREYMSFVEKFVEEGLMNTDQQIIYAMANLGTLNKSIQTYRSDGRHNWYFHLAYLCRENGFLRNRRH